MVGFGFITKMMQAFVVVPAFALAYLERSTVRLGLFSINYDSRQEVLDAARADLDAAERSAALDPANATVLGTTGSYYAVTRHPAEALRMFGLAAERQPAFAPFARNVQDSVRWAYTGDRVALARITEPGVTRPQIGDDYRKSRKAAEALPVRAPMRGDFVFAVPIGVGEYPMRALYQGRMDFLLGDRADAARDGGEILAFVGDTKLTRRNGWLLKVLTSYAKMYQGEKPAALAAAHEALALAPRSLDAVHWATASAFLAPVLAWSGAQDEAAAMLDELSTSVPGMPPAVIARDALIATTLSGNARYKALVVRLEAQMAATKLE